MSSTWDVLIVGGGPAGLSAALVLGRARRRVLLIDDDRPRNAAAGAVNGFLSRDGIAPRELRSISREQLRRYLYVELRDGSVTEGRRVDGGFEVCIGGGDRVRGRRLVIATGVADVLPVIDGLLQLYGRSVFHCPYCDGWEVRDRSLAVYGAGERGAGLAIELRPWSDDVILCTDGASDLSETWRARLDRHRIEVRESKVARLQGRDGQLEAIVFVDGSELGRHALFLSTRRRQQLDLARQLGCPTYEDAGCHVDHMGRSEVPGLFVIGDASRDVLQAIVAAGEGAAAAIALNAELIAEDYP